VLNPEERTTAVKEFLTEVARRRFLDEVQRRLRTEGSPVVIEREAGIPTWVAYLLADQASASDNREVLKLIDLGELPVPSECSLHSIFGLSVAEARLAQGLARGETLEKVARCLGIKMSTARTHLKVIFAKTGTRRQAALTAALSRLAHLLGD
jgi:DNA-binding CsgD family transcriptional regulator